MVAIPEKYHDLLTRPVLLSLATLMPDGQPQVTPVWGDFDGTFVRVNTAAGRQKHKNMEERPQVTVMLLDPENPQRYIEVRGKVTTISAEGGDAHIDALAKKYLGTDKYPYANPADTRVICYIEPERVIGQG
ncbi:MAG TPA: PPOX class F420-dependent oxidoreductase [Thermomicrobiales bacterium]